MEIKINYYYHNDYHQETIIELNGFKDEEKAAEILKHLDSLKNTMKSNINDDDDD